MKSSSREKAEGALHKVKGKVKEMAGKITNNRILTVDGKAGQVTGQTQDKVGEVKKVFGK